MSVSQIGRCKGCDKPKQLDDGVCQECLTHPTRKIGGSARKWAEWAHRCRTEPDFHLAVYMAAKTDQGKARIVAAFGLPKGVGDPIWGGLRIVGKC
jgi:hypothetical protein